MAEDPGDDLTEEQLYDAAAGDLRLLAVLMLVGSAIFSAVNWWLGSLGWIIALSTVLSTAATSLGLLKHNELVAAATKIGFGFGGLGAPVVGIVGIAFGLFGEKWGWALFAGAVLYFGFSVLGLEILDRAEKAGVLEELEGT